MIKLKNFFAAAAVLGLALSVPASALAADLNYNANTTLSLTSPAITLTILSGSKATSIVVNAGSFVVVVPASSTFTVTSASRDLSAGGTSNSATSLTCSGGVAQLAITTGTSAETATVNILSGQCSSSGGGSPSPSPAPAPSPSPAPAPAPAPAASNPSPTPPPPAPVPPVVITLPTSSTDGDTVKLAGNPTIYLVKPDGLHPFDSWQSYLNYKNQSTKPLLTVANGSYTVSQIVAKNLLNQGQAIASGFAQSLQLGMAKGQPIMGLQQFLNSHGFILTQSGPGSPGNETQLFGANTRKALTKFQNSVGLKATGKLDAPTLNYLKNKGY